MFFQMYLYFSVAVLVFGTIAKAIKIIRMPVHLRWDLYPIPHEKGKDQYGGSYYEETEWWTKPAGHSFFNTAREMGKEIFAIQTLYRNNRSMWYFSFPFHLGLYLLIAFAGMLFLGAVLQELGMEIAAASANPIGKGMYALTLLCGIAGWILGTFGALGLLLSRTFKGELRRYSAPSDYFNLLLLLALFTSGIFAWLSADRSFSILRDFAQQLMFFQPVGNLPAAVMVQLILTSVFFIYLPITHMTHFIGKYFTYHKVRWQDEPTRRGSQTEGDILEALKEKISWPAPHIQTGRTWADAASDEGDGKDGK